MLPAGAKRRPHRQGSSRRRRRCRGSDPAAAYTAAGRHDRRRAQRVRRLRRADRRQRRAGAEPELRLRQEARVQGPHQAERGRELVGASTPARWPPAPRPPTCWPSTGGSSRWSCRPRSASRAAPTASSSARTSSASTTSRARRSSTAQFTEVDFFIRYLAQEAGLGVNMLPDLDAPPDPDKVNLVFAEDGVRRRRRVPERADAGGNRLAGCVTWAPKTTEVVDQAGGKARCSRPTATC